MEIGKKEAHLGCLHLLSIGNVVLVGRDVDDLLGWLISSRT